MRIMHTISPALAWQYWDAARYARETAQPLSHVQPEGTHRELEIVTARYRSRCRVCFAYIPKGQPCLQFWRDFTGNGIWSASQCRIHLHPCVAREE